MTTENMEDFAVPTEQTVSGQSSELIGELVLLRPVQDEKVIETVNGRNLARFCEALIVVDGEAQPPRYRNLGETPIFWEVVRRKLNDASPWIAGRIMKREGQNYYSMIPPEPDQLDGIRRVLKQHANDPIPVEDPERPQDETF